ncbi:MAG: helix-turn-helix transcriptional regulator [Bacilli bacterium]|nr:helix-turn-helix transcriptional regulator [Bacilli bacterium]
MIYEKMKEIRTYYLITQKQMADILKTSRSNYAGWENGIDPISIQKLNEFCNHFNISLDYICDISEVTNYKNMKNEINLTQIGERMREVRINNNDTQNAVANAINVDQSNYSKYEHGKIIIRTYPLVEFAKHYNVSMDWLCGKIETNPKIK